MDNFLKQLILGLGIAFGISVSSFALYSFFKQVEKLNLKSNLGSKHSKQITVKMSIPSSSVGFLIDKSGELVKSIQTTTQTKINFCQQNDFKNEKYLIITGVSKNVIAAQALINNILDDHSQIVTQIVNVDIDDIGLLMGKNRATIKTFCEESGAHIKVINKNQDPFLKIYGTLDQVNCAKQLINKRLSKRKLKKFHESQEINTKLNELDMFEHLTPIHDNGCVEVYVSAVCNPSRFWVQLFGNQSIQLDRLLDEMTEFYRVSVNQKLMQISNFHVNDIVAAKCTRDKHWYRAKIVNLNESCLNKKITVHYLDFGDESKIFPHEICSLTENYLSKLKFQAIECSLNGIKSCDGKEWSEEAIKYFTQITYASQWKQMLAKPVQVFSKPNQTGNLYLIDLIDINQIHDINIAEDLIAKGFAQSLNQI